MQYVPVGRVTQQYLCTRGTYECKQFILYTIFVCLIMSKPAREASWLLYVRKLNVELARPARFESTIVVLFDGCYLCYEYKVLLVHILYYEYAPTTRSWFTRRCS